MTTLLERMRTELNSVVSGSAPGLPTADRLCSVSASLLGMDGAAVSMVFDGASRGTYGSSGVVSRRLDEYQFTFGEGPCLDATSSGTVVHAPDLNVIGEQRWPMFTQALVGEGIRAVFALPVKVASDCVGALDLYRVVPGPLAADQLAGAVMAAEMAALPLLTLISDIHQDENSLPKNATEGSAWTRDGQPALKLDRVEVYQATGMLIAQLDVSAAEALDRLRGYALATGRTASEVAYAILKQGLELERDDHDDVHDDTGRPERP